MVTGIISRVGGKSWLVNDLIRLLPQHRCYIEPFCGGARLFFAKERSPIEILNDADNILVNFYRVVQSDEKRQNLIKLLNETPYSRSIFNHFRRIEPEGEIEKAVRFFYLSKASFAGDVERGGFGIPSKGTGRNPAMTYQNSIDAIEHMARRLKGVTVECLDYKDCIQRYDSESSLFYVDSPYYSHEHYYGDIFTEQDHYQLSEILHSIKGRAMVSHYANGFYDRLYQGWHRYEFSSFKGSHKAEAGEGKPKTTECLWCNFKQQRNRSLFD